MRARGRRWLMTVVASAAGLAGCHHDETQVSHSDPASVRRLQQQEEQSYRAAYQRQGGAQGGAPGQGR